jgi:hypothetical protein
MVGLSRQGDSQVSLTVIYRSQQPDTRPVAYESAIMTLLDAAVRAVAPDAQIVAVLREKRAGVPEAWTVLELPYAGSPYLDGHRRTWMGLMAATNERVYITDHDAVYCPEHFGAPWLPDHIGMFGYNPDYVSLTRRGWFVRKDEPGTFALRGPRGLLLEHYRQAVDLLADGNICVWDEPGYSRFNTPRAKPCFFRQTCRGVYYFRAPTLNVDLRDGANVTGDYMAPNYQESIEPWGEWREFWRSLQREDLVCGK